MLQTPEQTANLIDTICKEQEIDREVETVYYREDYQDYQIIFFDKTHCELREKLIDIMINGDAKMKADAQREIVFRIKNAIEFEEWERL